MFTKLLNSLRLPETQNVDLDDPSTTELHAQIIQTKPFLKRTYQSFYKKFLRIVDENPNGQYVELGSGGGFIHEVIPKVVRTDILPLKNIDLVLNVERLPFRDQSVDAFFMINVFHHIKRPVCFLEEMQRCLKPQGKIAMVEPANTLWGRFVYQNFHHESFDPHDGWSIKGTGPLSDANGALPWIVFCRDRAQFETTIQYLKIDRIQYHTPFCYLLSGGFSYKQLFPSFLYLIVAAVEKILFPLGRYLGMFFTIELQKRV